MKRKDLKVISFKNREDLKAIKIFVVMLQCESTGIYFSFSYYFSEDRAYKALEDVFSKSDVKRGYVTSKLVWL